MDYPKRLYRAGKGFTVNNLEEEQAFLGENIPVVSPVPDVKEITTKVEAEEPDEEHPAYLKQQMDEALEYLVSTGYSKTSAKKIVKQYGLENILKAKSEGRSPQE